MNLSSRFVCEGGSVVRRRFGRPKLRIFATLGIGWSAVSAVPIWGIFSTPAGAEFWWIKLACSAFVLPQPIFIGLALLFLFIERPREWTESVDDPNYDPRNVY